MLLRLTSQQALQNVLATLILGALRWVPQSPGPLVFDILWHNPGQPPLSGASGDTVVEPPFIRSVWSRIPHGPLLEALGEQAERGRGNVADVSKNPFVDRLSWNIQVEDL